MNNAPILDANRIAASLQELGDRWADENAAAAALEETRQSLYSRIAAEHIGKGESAAKAELLAKADPVYDEHLKAMVEARRKATRARVRYDVARIKAELMRSNASTERALATLR